MSPEQKTHELHERLLDPETGIFAKVLEIRLEQTHMREDLTESQDAIKALVIRTTSLETSRSRLKGWLLGVAAAGGLTGAFAEKVAGWL